MVRAGWSGVYGLGDDERRGGGSGGGARASLERTATGDHSPCVRSGYFEQGGHADGRAAGPHARPPAAAEPRREDLGGCAVPCAGARRLLRDLVWLLGRCLPAHRSPLLLLCVACSGPTAALLCHLLCRG